MSDVKVNNGIDERATVNEIIRQHPATVEVFNRFGIDSCCGGGLPVGVAAERHGLDIEKIRAALNASIGG